MSVWKPIDDIAKNGDTYAVWFREPPSKGLPWGYGYWVQGARIEDGKWLYINPKKTFTEWIEIDPDHRATHYADMSPPEDYAKDYYAHNGPKP
jgi:hypothetical protein